MDNFTLDELLQMYSALEYYMNNYDLEPADMKAAKSAYAGLEPLIDEKTVLRNIRTAETVDEARSAAVDWQNWQSNHEDLSYGELSFWQAELRQLARKYPELRDEFVENEII